MVGSGPAQQAMLGEGSDSANLPKQTFELSFQKARERRLGICICICISKNLHIVALPIFNKRKQKTKVGTVGL